MEHGQNEEDEKNCHEGQKENELSWDAVFLLECSYLVIWDYWTNHYCFFCAKY